MSLFPPDEADIFTRWTIEVGKYFDYLYFDGDIPETKYGRVCEQPDDDYYYSHQQPYDPDLIFYSDTDTESEPEEIFFSDSETEEEYLTYLQQNQLRQYNQFEFLALHESGIIKDC